MSQFRKSAVATALLVAGLVGTGQNAFAVLEEGSDTRLPPQVEYDPSGQPEFIPIFRHGVDPSVAPVPSDVGSASTLPEPSTLMLALGAGAAFAMGHRRRSRAKF
jgi:hypothetical protein